MTRKDQRRQPKETTLCVYCGRCPATTRDHVIPRSFFHVRPANLFTVPVCEPCNHEKSLDEPYLRDSLTVDLFGSEHPEAQALFKEKVKRSIGYNSSDLAKDALRTQYPVSAVTEDGTKVEDLTGIVVNKERVDRVLTCMVRGLLYHLKGQRIPPDYVVTVNHVPLSQALEVVETVVAFTHEGPYVLGDDVVVCKFVQAPDDPATTMWLLYFYRGVIFFVDTMPAGMFVEEQRGST